MVSRRNTPRPPAAWAGAGEDMTVAAADMELRASRDAVHERDLSGS